MTVKYNPDGSVDLKETTYTELADFYAGIALERLVSKGGTGLKAAIYEAITVALAKNAKLLEAKEEANK